MYNFPFYNVSKFLRFIFIHLVDYMLTVHCQYANRITCLQLLLEYSNFCCVTDTIISQTYLFKLA